MKGRLHMFARELPSGMRVALCGQFFGDAARVTTSEPDVTCRVCTTQLAVPAYFTGALLGAPEWVAVVRQRWDYATLLERVLAGDEVTRAWPTWRAAVRDYVSAADDGCGVGSGSLEPRCGGPGEKSTEGSAQRNAARLMPVGRALERAFAGAWTSADYPASSVCVAILVGRVVGRAVEMRPRDPRGGGQRKHRGVARVGWDATDIAAAHRGAGGGEITARDVDAIVRHGGTRIEDELMGRGLVHSADGWLRRRVECEAESEMADPNVIRGWRAIADELGVSESYAREAAGWPTPIPAHKVGGMVEADKRDLATWWKAQRRSVAKQSAA